MYRNMREMKLEEKRNESCSCRVNVVGGCRFSLDLEDIWEGREFVIRMIEMDMEGGILKLLDRGIKYILEFRVGLRVQTRC